MKTLPKNCIHCHNHKVMPDPDLNDWFCDDDVKVVCLLNSKNITFACRPYQIEKECERPSWCPLQISNDEHQALSDEIDSAIGECWKS